MAQLPLITARAQKTVPQRKRRGARLDLIFLNKINGRQKIDAKNGGWRRRRRQSPSFSQTIDKKMILLYKISHIMTMKPRKGG